MSAIHSHLHFSPVPASAQQRSGQLLLVGQQSQLIPQLKLWPKHWRKLSQVQVRFASAQEQALIELADNSVDLVVVAAGEGRSDGLIKQLVRVARQGLISL